MINISDLEIKLMGVAKASSFSLLLSNTDTKKLVYRLEELYSVIHSLHGFTQAVRDTIDADPVKAKQMLNDIAYTLDQFLSDHNFGANLLTATQNKTASKKVDIGDQHVQMESNVVSFTPKK